MFCFSDVTTRPIKTPTNINYLCGSIFRSLKSKDEYVQYVSFFSLLREFICSNPDQRISSPKVSVKHWFVCISLVVLDQFYAQPLENGTLFNSEDPNGISSLS